jgi:hypothetical protein
VNALVDAVGAIPEVQQYAPGERVAEPVAQQPQALEVFLGNP